MAKPQKKHVRSREDLSEMPEWLKEKQCPHKKQYMSGKRIMPRNLNGKEPLAWVIDEVFLAYNSARLREACQLLDCFNRGEPLPRHAFRAQLPGPLGEFQV